MGEIDAASALLDGHPERRFAHGFSFSPGQQGQVSPALAGPALAQQACGLKPAMAVPAARKDRPRTSTRNARTAFLLDGAFDIMITSL